MKALLKRALGGIKIAAAFLPFAAALGGEATFIWLAVHGNNTYEAAITEARESPAMQEVIDHDLGVLKEQVDNNQITVQEYQEKMKYWDSTNNLIYFLKQDEETNKKYLDKINKGHSMVMGGVFASIGWAAIAIAVTWIYAEECLSDILESGKDDFIEARDISEEEKKRKEKRRFDKECDEYREEL